MPGWDRLLYESLVPRVDGVDGVDEDLKPSALTTRMHIDGDFVYAGSATPGSLTSASVWMITRLDTTDGGEFPELHPNGKAEFVNSWDNRATLSYS